MKSHGLIKLSSLSATPHPHSLRRVSRGPDALRLTSWWPRLLGSWACPWAFQAFGMFMASPMRPWQQRRGTPFCVAASPHAGAPARSTWRRGRCCSA